MSSAIRSKFSWPLFGLLTVLIGCSDGDVYTLYRDSVTGSDLRLHVASFDAADGESYNKENCRIAAHLFQQQPGVTVKYWCEKGRFKK